MADSAGPLATLLDEDAPNDARIEAARALGRQKCAEAVTPLVEVLHEDPHGLLAWAARDALGRIRDPGTAETALSWLEDEHPVFRGHGAELLGQMGVRRAAPALLALALGDDPLPIREKALEAIGRVGSPDVLPALLALFETGPLPLRIRIPSVLARLHSPEAVPTLIAGLDDVDFEVRDHCIEALRVLKDPRAAPRLRALLEDSRDPILAERVTAALARLEA